LGRISGPKSEEITGSWRKLHKEELHNFYSSPVVVVVVVIKSRRMRGNVNNEYKFLVGKYEGTRPLGDLRVDARTL
jgi:hypothetical protein